MDLAAADDDRAAIESVIHGYFDAFSCDVAKAAAFFGEPTLLASLDRVATLDTRAAVETWLMELRARLAPLGYAHSRVVDSRVKFLNATTALCSMTRIRMAADGTELPRGGATYLLRKHDGAWKIHALIATDPDKLVGAD